MSIGANLLAIIHDPQSAAAYALAETIDLAHAGILHPEVAHDAMLNQAALLAANVAVQPQLFPKLPQHLALRSYAKPAELAVMAVVAGFAEKWHER